MFENILEWLANKQHTTFDVDYTNKWLEKRMKETFGKVYTISKEYKITMRMACYYLALNKLNEHYERAN